MKWLNVEDLRFDNHGCIFTIPRDVAQWAAFTAKILEFRADRSDPEGLAAALYKMVVNFHPELEGCTVVGLYYDMTWAQWEVHVLHPKLPLVPFNEPFPKERLIKNEQSNVESQGLLQQG